MSWWKSEGKQRTRAKAVPVAAKAAPPPAVAPAPAKKPRAKVVTLPKKPRTRVAAPKAAEPAKAAAKPAPKLALVGQPQRREQVSDFLARGGVIEVLGLDGKPVGQRTTEVPYD